MLCAPAIAHAACPGTSSNCPSPTYNNLTVGGVATFNGSLTGSGLTTLFTSPGPIGSVTPNAGTFTTLTTTGQTQFGAVKWIYAALPAFPAAADTALAAAITQCSALGTKLVIPQGIYVLDGSHAPSILNNCSIEGSGVPGTGFGFSSPGTLIELTSTSVSPFKLGTTCEIRGVNFFWPTQTGSTVYPPLFSDVGVSQVGPCVFDNVNVVNAYDIFTQTSAALGGLRMTNSTLYAVHHGFTLKALGDGFALANNRYSPAMWLLFGGNPSAVGHAAQNNKAFDIQAGGAVNINAANEVFVGWQYGIYLESGALWAESQVNATWDTVGTIVDSTSGGTYAAGNVLTGQNAGCALSGNTWGIGINGGQQPCFNMGSAPFQELALVGFQSNGTQGDFIATAGAAVTMLDSSSLNIGGILAVSPGAGDFYQVRVTSSGTPEIRIQNNRFAGTPANAHIHGIGVIGSGIPNSLLVQNNTFSHHQEAITGNFPAGTNISGNNSSDTNGSVSMVETNSNPIMSYGNYWDKQPLPTVSSCGSGAVSAAGNTPNGGFITTGTGSVLSCTVTMPLPLYSKCLFQPASAISVGATPSGVPAAWTLTFYLGATPQSSESMNVFYSCPGM